MPSHHVCMYVCLYEYIAMLCSTVPNAHINIDIPMREQLKLSIYARTHTHTHTQCFIFILSTAIGF